MRKRKILAIIIALMLCVSLTACHGGQAKSEDPSKIGTFVIVSRQNIFYDNYYLTNYVMYDPETMVMYTYFYNVGLTVMYNADGTLKLYSPNGETN